MLNFEDFCKQLKTKDSVYNGWEGITYYNDDLLHGDTLSINKSLMSKQAHKRALERFYDEIYVRKYGKV